MAALTFSAPRGSPWAAAVPCFAVSDLGTDDNDAGFSGFPFGFLQHRLNGIRIVAVLYPEYLPAIGFIALAHILRKSDFRTSFNADGVGIIQDDQLTEF